MDYTPFGNELTPSNESLFSKRKQSVSEVSTELVEDTIEETPSDYYDRVMATKSMLPKPQDTGSGIGKVIKGLTYGAQGAAAALPKAMDRLATYISEKTGAEKGGLFKSLSDAIKPEEVDQLTADDLNFKIGKVITGIGGGVVQIGTLTMLGIPPPIAMALVGGTDAYAEGAGAGGVAAGTALGGVTGGLFGGVGSLRNPATDAAIKTLKKVIASGKAKPEVIKALTNKAAKLIEADRVAKEVGGFIEHGVSRMGRPARIGILGGAGAAQSVGGSLVQTGQLPKPEDLAIEMGTMGVFGAMGGPGDLGMRKALIKRGWPEENAMRLSYEEVKKKWKNKEVPPAPLPVEPVPTGQATVEGMFTGEPRPGSMSSDVSNEANISQRFGEKTLDQNAVDIQLQKAMEAKQTAEGLRRKTEQPIEDAGLGGIAQPEYPAFSGPAVPGMTVDQMVGTETGQTSAPISLTPKAEVTKNIKNINIDTLTKRGFRTYILKEVGLVDAEIKTLVDSNASPDKFEFDGKRVVELARKRVGSDVKTMKDTDLELELNRTLNADRASAVRTELANRKQKGEPTKLQEEIKKSELEKVLETTEEVKKTEPAPKVEEVKPDIGTLIRSGEYKEGLPIEQNDALNRDFNTENGAVIARTKVKLSPKNYLVERESGTGPWRIFPKEEVFIMKGDQKGKRWDQASTEGMTVSEMEVKKPKVTKKVKPFEEVAANAGLKKSDAVEEVLGDKKPLPIKPWAASNVTDPKTVQENLDKKTSIGVQKSLDGIRSSLRKGYQTEKELERGISNLKKLGELSDKEYNQVKIMESELSTLRTEMEENRKALALGSKPVKVDDVGLTIGDSSRGPIVGFGDTQAPIVVTRPTENTHELSVFIGKDPTKVPDSKNPGYPQATIHIETKKGKHTLTSFDKNPILDERYVDKLLDQAYDKFPGLKVNLKDTPKLSDAMERRKPVSHEDITLGSGLGILGSMDDLTNLKEIGKKVKERTKSLALGWRRITDTGGMVRSPKPSPEGKPGKYVRYTPAEEMAYLHQIISLRGEVEPSLLDLEIRTDVRLRDLLSLLDYLGDPIQSMDPKLRTIASLSQKREGAEYKIIAGALEYGKKHFDWLRDKPEKQKELIAHLHDMGTSKDPMIIESARAYRQIMEEFAMVGDLKARGMWVDKYSTISYDYNKLYEYFAEPIKKASRFEEVGDRIASFLRPEDFPEIKKMVDTYGSVPWDKLPTEVKEVMKAKVFGWTGASTWEDAPAHIQSMVPKEKWNAYFEHRTAGDSLKQMMGEDFFKMYETYVRSTARAITSEPYLREVRPIVNSMPGATNWLTKRSYLERYVKSQLWGRESLEDKTYNIFAKRINKELYDLWKVQPMPLYLPSKISAKVQQYTYRGTLGPDTAIRNLLQNMNTFAEGGKVPVLKALQARLSKSNEWGEFDKHMKLMEEFSHHTGTAESMGKIAKWDSRITTLALSPLNLTEHVNKFISYMGGLDSARAKGLDFNNAHLYGIERAFTIMENPMMSEAQWHAWNQVWKTQFGYTPSHQSPIMRSPMGRMSTIFWSYPAKTFQLWRTGMQESAISGDSARLLRYAGLMGFSLTANYWLGKTLGIDLSTVFGTKGILPNDLTPTWIKLAKDAYVAAGGGDYTQQDKYKAKDEMDELMKMLFLPQYRSLKKLTPIEIPYITEGKGSAWKNIERGYSTYGKNEQPLVETNTYQQIFNMLGFPPLAPLEMREVKRRVDDKAAIEVHDKAEAVNAILKLMKEGESSKAYSKLREYNQKGVKVKMSDVADAKKRRELDIMETFQKRGPKGTRKEYGAEIEEMQKKYLPNFRNGKRNLYSSPREE